MNAAMTSNGSSAKRLMVLILAILGIVAIVAGILYLAGSANSLHFMVGSTHKGHHQVRAAVSFVIGLALLAAAWFTNRAASRR
jgi:uncharacterized membrane protein